MTILEVTAAPFGPGREGGGERHPTWFAEELARFEPVVFAFADAAVEPPGRGRLPIPARSLDLPPFLTPTNPLPRLASLGAIEGYLRSHAGEIEFVHVHNLRTAMASLWLLLASLRKKGDRFRVILTDHGARFFPWPRLTARMVDYYAPVSHYSDRILQALARRPSRVVPAAVSTAFVRAGPPPPWSARDIDLLFVGRIVPWKRPERVIDLAARASARLGRPVRAVIAGAVGDRGFWDALQRKAAGHSGSLGIEFVANPPDAALVELYGRARLFVFASDPVDSFGRRHAAPELSSATVLEAAARGTPAVAGRIPAALENVRDGETGILVDAFDGESTRDRVCDLLRGGPAWQRLSDAANAYVMGERTYPRIVERFRAYLEDIRRGAV